MNYILETERLRLREMTMDDVESLMGILSDPVAMTYYPAVLDEEGTRAWVQRNLDRYARNGIGFWIAESRETGEFIGQIGLLPQEIDGQQEVEVGYLLLTKHWGQGYATEGAQGCMDYAFAQLGVGRVVCTIRPENQPSRRVAERLGMTVEKEYVKSGLLHLVYVFNKEQLGQI